MFFFFNIALHSTSLVMHFETQFALFTGNVSSCVQIRKLLQRFHHIFPPQAQSIRVVASTGKERSQFTEIKVVVFFSVFRQIILYMYISYIAYCSFIYIVKTLFCYSICCFVHSSVYLLFVCMFILSFISSFILSCL